jgi:hypothetical protein
MMLKHVMWKTFYIHPSHDGTTNALCVLCLSWQGSYFSVLYSVYVSTIEI